MTPPVRSRWLSRNETSRIPRTHIILDSEAIVTPDDHGQTHTFRCAVTTCDRMSHRSDEWLEPEYAEHASSLAVWEWISNRCKPRNRTIVVAHNAGYDMRICEAFKHLPDLGWKLNAFSLNPGATWATWRRDGASFSIVDSLSWFPTSLENLGRALGLSKRELPDICGSDGEWLTRCRSDVEILRRGWLTTVEWLREADCGNWKPTGAGQGFAAFRHRFLTHDLLIHDDQEQRERERRASWTGRAEPWAFGPQTGGPFHEWDYTCCYAEIARTCDVPTRYVGEVLNPDVLQLDRASAGKAYLVECTVKTETPTVPTEHDGHIIWPVGTFRTTLWDHEIRLALDGGAYVEVHRAWQYRTEPALSAWATWVLSLVHDSDASTSPVVRILAKHWSRSLIGRFGSRFPVWEPYGDARNSDARLSGFSNYDTGETGQLLEVGGSAFLAVGVTDHPQSCPQIMSWIMAEARVRLWTAIQTAGAENVIYVDTDSLITTALGSARLVDAGHSGLRKKAEYRVLDIIGTRSLVENLNLKAAGVPRGSVRTSANTWSGEAWSSMMTDLANGNTGSVRVNERTATLGGDDTRRRQSANGGSEPYILDAP